MAFILEAVSGESVVINAWNWRPTLELLHSANLITDEQHELLGIHCGTDVDSETASRIADFLDGVLARMKPGERIRADLVVTDLPKNPAVFTPQTKSTDIDAVELYSAKYEWLLTFAAFARRSGGFLVS